MKVYLSKPRYHWISPYKILEHIFFWTDWSKCGRSDKYIPDEEYVDHPAWVEKASDYLTPVSKGIQWVLDKIHPPIDYVKIDYWDVWSMDHTLSPIILPMLKQLKSVKHGSGHVDDEDVPMELRSIHALPKEEWETDGNWHKRWDYVLDEMIWAFEQLANPDTHEDQFWHERGEIDWEEMKKPFPEGQKTREIKWTKESKVDWEGLKAHNARIDNGTRLFGKYYRGLWD